MHFAVFEQQNAARGFLHSPLSAHQVPTKQDSVQQSWQRWDDDDYNDDDNDDDVDDD